MFKPKWCNCFIWAIIQRLKYSGSLKWYLGFRIPHVSWIKNDITWSYNPRNRVGDGTGKDFIILFEGVPMRHIKGE